MQVEIAPEFRPYADVAIARLRYLFPRIGFGTVDGHITVVGASDAELEGVRREVQYALYRERIFDRTLSLRSALIGAVTAR